MTASVNMSSSGDGAQRDTADYQRNTHFDASPEVVFEAITTAAGVAAWWAPATGSGIAGGELRLTMGPPEPLVLHVDVAQPSSKVVWSVLACPFLPDWDGTTITFELRPGQGGGCELAFRHRGLTPQLECYDQCQNGWDHFIPSLGLYAEAGQGNPQGSDADLARREARDRARTSSAV
jgi:uncharacterized protein YndB with AHSA1/START domain